MKVEKQGWIGVHKNIIDKSLQPPYWTSPVYDTREAVKEAMLIQDKELMENNPCMAIIPIKWEEDE